MMIQQSKLSKPLWLLTVLLIFSACQKDKDLDISLSLTAFSIESETRPAMIDEQSNTITVFVGDMMDWTGLTITFQTGSSNRLMYGDTELTSGSSTLDLTRPISLSLQSSISNQKEAWTVDVKSLFADYGMGNILHRAGNADQGRLFYFDQYGSGPHQYLNCGPTVTAMAIKWGYPNYTGTPQQIRSAIRANGGWWYTNDIIGYLSQQGIHTAIADLRNISDTEYANRLMDIVDRGYLAILCLDMYYVSQETDAAKRTNKFYVTNTKEWGHWGSWKTTT